MSVVERSKIGGKEDGKKARVETCKSWNDASRSREGKKEERVAAFLLRKRLRDRFSSEEKNAEEGRCGRKSRVWS